MTGTRFAPSHVPMRLEDMINGYQHTQVLHVAVRLGLADQLARGARSAPSLASAIGANEHALYRLLRALARPPRFLPSMRNSPPVPRRRPRGRIMPVSGFGAAWALPSAVE